MPNSDDRHDTSIGCGAIALGIVLALVMWGWALGVLGRMR